MNLGVAPAAIVTIIVSPIALDKPKIIEAVIPDRAAGNTTLKETSYFLAPKAYAASFNDG